MAGTVTGSSGLNNFLEGSQNVQTTLPSWYDAAQQNIAGQAGSALGQAPQFANTVGQQAVNTLQGNANPFTQAQGTLNQISSGAANPWIVDQQTGTVTPNVNTALGGLFQAENQQLNTILPYATAPVESANIASGNFGSLRGQQATDAARAVAQANLNAQQMTAALQNQQTGASAANALGNVGQQGAATELSTGAAQMNAPFQGIGNYANLINAENVPGQVTQQTIESPLQMVSALAGAPTTAGNLLSSLFGSSSTSGTLSNALSNIPGLSSLFSSTSSNSGGYTPAQTQSAIDQTTANNMAPANPNSTLDPSQLPADSGGE